MNIHNKEKIKIILAYSGGLDTSIILKWLQENYHSEVIPYTADIGQKMDKKKIIKNARKLGVKNIIIEGAKLTLEIPVKFVNSEKSPGLKKGGVLNIVRRKIELKCPAENIPSELMVDLDNTEIGTSIKISSINLPKNIVPTIQGRDFVIATVASPTVVVEPEKPAEEAAADATLDGVEKPTEEGKDQDTKVKDQSKKAAEDKKEDNTKK